MQIRLRRNAEMDEADYIYNTGVKFDDAKKKENMEKCEIRTSVLARCSS